MSYLLEKLKVKSSPIKTEGVIIHLPGISSVREHEPITRDDIMREDADIEPIKEPTGDHVRLHDRTDEEFDRATFLDKIRDKLLVAPKHTISKPTTTIPTISKTPKKKKPAVVS